MEARDAKRMNIEDYRALDARSDQRWEYVHGEAWAMAGGSIEHNLVVGNVVRALRAALEGRDCFALSEGQKVATPATRGYHYPDAVVVCGRVEVDRSDDHAIANPTLLVEVLSPTTADYDRAGRFGQYRTLASLREYVLVDIERRVVEHHLRLDTGQWLFTEIRAGAIALSSLAVAIAWDDLWLDLARLAAARC